MAPTGSWPQPYKYTPLSNGQIRVVKILPGSHDDEISLKLELTLLSSKPFYHALSYCWGDNKALVECQCLEDGKPGSVLHVTETLHQALIQIRHERDEIVVWVDQLCIDQKNDEEKKHQIRLMKQIYTSAHQVVIWLGEAYGGTERVFNLIQNVYDQLMQQSKAIGIENTVYDPANPRSAYCLLNLTSADAEEWVAFRKLLQRPWFDRVWTVQELVLAERDIIVCGPYTCMWEQLQWVCQSVKQADRHIPGHESHLKGVDADVAYLGSCLGHYKGGDDAKEVTEYCLKFTNLLRRMMHRRTSVPHDKIYGILGLAVDVDIDTYPIDPKKSFQQVYSYATKYIIQQYSDLEVLRRTSILPVGKTPKFGPTNRPSWVPDYRFDNSRTNNLWYSYGPGVAQHGQFRLYNATGMSKAIISVDDSLDLCLQGVYLGTIKEISDPDGCGEGDAPIGPNVARCGQWANMAASLCAPDDIYAPTNEPAHLAYSRLRIRDYLPGEYTRADHLARSRSTLSIPEPSASAFHYTPNGERLLRYDKDDVITVKIIQSTTNHKLALLSSGHMGLVHQSCELDDQVWLLLGGDMPFVLRPLATSKYMFKGETYVHGVMEGEYLIQKHKTVMDQRDNQTWLDSLSEGVPFSTENVVLI